MHPLQELYALDQQGVRNHELRRPLIEQLCKEYNLRDNPHFLLKRGTTAGEMQHIAIGAVTSQLGKRKREHHGNEH